MRSSAFYENVVDTGGQIERLPERGWHSSGRDREFPFKGNSLGVFFLLGLIPVARPVALSHGQTSARVLYGDAMKYALNSSNVSLTLYQIDTVS